MDEEEINYITLRKIQQMEKNSPKLSDLQNNFYENVSKYIKNLEERLEGEEKSQKGKILQEEILNSKKIFLNIHEQREKKIVLAAISKARGGKPLIDNMEENEKKFFNSILENISKYREKFFLKNNENQTEEIERKENKDENKKKIKKNPIVRINEDIPNFIGTDKRKYNLKKNDILTISPDMCEMISRRKACEKIKM